jgi:hypothetical protein
VRVVEQGLFGQPRRHQRGQGGGGQQHVHDHNLVADGGERVDPSQDQSGHRTRQADQPDDLGGIWQLFATKEAAEKAAERLNSRGYDVIVTTAELAK